MEAPAGAGGGEELGGAQRASLYAAHRLQVARMLTGVTGS
jgi:hypothetical protein